MCKHDAVKNVYKALGIKAGLSTSTENRDIPQLIDINSLQVIDLKYNNYDAGRHLLCDVKITNADQRNYRGHVVVPGKAALDGEQEKVRKYNQQCIDCGCLFHPLVLEDQGRMGDVTRRVTNDLIARAQERRQGSLDPTGAEFNKRYWTARIVMALHRASCTGLQVRINNILSKRSASASASDTYLANEDEQYAAAVRGVM
jgi:hypothetical protein